MLSKMKVHTHLKPGQKGTKQLVEQYGQSLLCVRYWYDEIRGRQLKTVEIIVEEKPWQTSFMLKDSDLVPIHVFFEEKDLRDHLKTTGARWDPLHKVWHVTYGGIKGCELEKRISVNFITSKIQDKTKLPILGEN